jgi:hypothetical protein
MGYMMLVQLFTAHVQQRMLLLTLIHLHHLFLFIMAEWHWAIIEYPFPGTGFSGLLLPVS